MPREPLRIRRSARPRAAAPAMMASATASAPSARAAASPGTYTVVLTVLRLQPRHQYIELGRRHRRMQSCFVDLHRRPAGAQAQAIHRLQRQVAARQPRPRVFGQGFAADGLAGLGAADANHVAARRLLTEVVVVTDHAVDFGARQVQRRGDRRNRVGRNVAEGVLHLMQHGQQRARLLAMGVEDAAKDGVRVHPALYPARRERESGKLRRPMQISRTTPPMPLPRLLAPPPSAAAARAPG